MASNAPQACCTVGVKHEGQPTGTLTKIDNMEIYVAEPKADKAKAGKAILYLPDVIGIWNNSQLMADQFAANGYYTVIVDTFNGDPISLNKPDDFDFMAWLTKGTSGSNPHTFKEVDVIVAKAIDFLHSKGYKDIAAVGYCFGAKYVTRFMGPEKGSPVKVGYVAHPSFVDEDELAAIKGPYSISAAETDEIFPKDKRVKSEEILKNTGLPYQINLFQGVVHGFAVRGDLDNKWQLWTKERAFNQAVEWINYHL